MTFECLKVREDVRRGLNSLLAVSASSFFLALIGMVWRVVEPPEYSIFRQYPVGAITPAAWQAGALTLAAVSLIASRYFECRSDVIAAEMRACVASTVTYLEALEMQVSAAHCDAAPARSDSSRTDEIWC
jgi:hypothetical protein